MVVNKRGFNSFKYDFAKSEGPRWSDVATGRMRLTLNPHPYTPKVPAPNLRPMVKRPPPISLTDSKSEGAQALVEAQPTSYGHLHPERHRE